MTFRTEKNEYRHEYKQWLAKLSMIGLFMETKEFILVNKGKYSILLPPKYSILTFTKQKGNERR